MWYVIDVNELCHHGIRGQRWGRRRYQYEDGSLTPEGEKRYEVVGKRTIRYEDTRNRLRAMKTAAALTGAAVVAGKVYKTKKKIETAKKVASFSGTAIARSVIYKASKVVKQRADQSYSKVKEYMRSSDSAEKVKAFVNSKRMDAVYKNAYRYR